MIILEVAPVSYAICLSLCSLLPRNSELKDDLRDFLVS